MTTKEPRILGVEEVEAFVRYELFDPGRNEAIVAVTTRSGEPEPLIPPARLAQELAGKARVVVIPTGVVTWRLTSELPARLGVYGGAVRVWMPGLSPGSDPFVHPLMMVFTQEDVARVVARIRSIPGSRSQCGSPFRFRSRTGRRHLRRFRRVRKSSSGSAATSRAIGRSSCSGSRSSATS